MDEVALYLLVENVPAMAPRTLTLALSSLLILSGCQKEEIKTYRVAKDKTPATVPSEMPAGHPAPGGSSDQKADLPPGHPPMSDASSSNMASAAIPMPAAASGQDLVWTAPSNWQSKGSDQMRKGRFAIKGDGGDADLSIFAFPGAAGGISDNINRWRNQLGLPLEDPAKIADSSIQLKTDSGLDVVFVDLVGKTGDRILGAIIERGEASWFFKLRGPDALVGKEKDAFIAFLKTVKQP